MRRGVAPQLPAVEFTPWKPDRCEEPGCSEPHPSYSRNGMAGPWRCRVHDQQHASDVPERAKSAAPAPPAPQGRLL